MVTEGQIHYCVLKKTVKAEEIVFDSKKILWVRQPITSDIYTSLFFDRVEKKTMNFKINKIVR